MSSLSTIPVDVMRDAFSPRHFEKPEVADAWFELQVDASRARRGQLGRLAAPFLLNLGGPEGPERRVRRTPNETREAAADLVKLELDRTEFVSERADSSSRRGAYAAAGLAVTAIVSALVAKTGVDAQAVIATTTAGLSGLGALATGIEAAVAKGKANEAGARHQALLPLHQGIVAALGSQDRSHAA